MHNAYWILACFVLFSPFVGFILITVEFWAFDKPREAVIVWISRSTFLVSFLAAVILACGVWMEGKTHLYPWAVWFRSGEHVFVLSFLIDRLSTTMVLLTTLLCSLVGHFSATYLHAERGFLRFFLLLQTFAMGMLLLFLAGSVDLLFVGWELVGLTSVLLIMFFYERNAPVHNGIYTFVVYRICDIGLLAGMVFLHHFAHTTSFQHKVMSGHWISGMPHLAPEHATWVALLFVFAAMGKSAQMPMGGWLPRAMEGPTPSSAIFYGGLSVHAGVYLLLRAKPLLEQSPWACTCLIIIGAVTAIQATLIGRMQTDIKNALAYATMTQVGLMFIEIGLQLDKIATVHLVGHACLRTWQFLRSPSILQEIHQWRGTMDREFTPGSHLEALEQKLPGQWGNRLYIHALHRFYWEAFFRRFLIQPIHRLAIWLARWEQQHFADPRTPVPPKSPPSSETSRD